MALRAQHCKLQWYHRDHETGTGMETWTCKMGQVRMFRMFDVEDLQPNFFRVTPQQGKVVLIFDDISTAHCRNKIVRIARH